MSEARETDVWHLGAMDCDWRKELQGHWKDLLQNPYCSGPDCQKLSVK